MGGAPRVNSHNAERHPVVLRAELDPFVKVQCDRRLTEGAGYMPGTMLPGEIWGGGEGAVVIPATIDWGGQGPGRSRLSCGQSTIKNVIMYGMKSGVKKPADHIG